MDAADLLLRHAFAEEPPVLELFLHEAGPAEFHFYLRGLTLRDFADVFGAALRGWTLVLSEVPHGALAEEHWEPHTPENEENVREKTGLAIVQSREGARRLWRADRARSSGRVFGGAASAATLVRGGFSVPGRVVAESADAVRADEGRLEWAAWTSAPPEDAADRVRADLREGRLPAGAACGYASDADHFTRVLFTSRASYRRALAAALRGFVGRVARVPHVAPLRERDVDSILRAADGAGLYSSPQRDVLVTDRTVEVVAALGRTGWGVRGAAVPADGAKLLIYYDRTSGVWAAAS